MSRIFLKFLLTTCLFVNIVLFFIYFIKLKKNFLDIFYKKGVVFKFIGYLRFLVNLNMNY